MTTLLIDDGLVTVGEHDPDVEYYHVCGDHLHHTEVPYDDPRRLITAEQLARIVARQGRGMGDQVLKFMKRHSFEAVGDLLGSIDCVYNDRTFNEDRRRVDDLLYALSQLLIEVSSRNSYTFATA